MKEQLNCVELCLQSDGEPVESLWVKIRWQINRGDAIVGLCYRLPEQEEVDEAFRQLEDASYLQALVLMRDLSYLSIWKKHHSRARAIQEVSGMC